MVSNVRHELTAFAQFMDHLQSTWMLQFCFESEQAPRMHPANSRMLVSVLSMVYSSSIALGILQLESSLESDFHLIHLRLTNNRESVLASRFRIDSFFGTSVPTHFRALAS